jgi:hypothetical protein
MMTTTGTPIPLKAYSLRELAKIYQVDWRTFKKWLLPFNEEIGKKEGRYYKIPQVKVIFEKLSLPGYILPK